MRSPLIENGARFRWFKQPSVREFNTFNSKLKTQNSKLNSMGFTLIEIIIFIVIAGIFVPLTYVAFSTVLKQGTVPEDWGGARSIAEQSVELAAKRGFNQLVADISGSGALPACASIGASVTTGFGCTWAATRQTFNGTAFSAGAGNYILITVTVTTPMNNSLSTSTLVTNHGY
jgi:hypothetical protein